MGFFDHSHFTFSKARALAAKLSHTQEQMLHNLENIPRALIAMWLLLSAFDMSDKVEKCSLK